MYTIIWRYQVPSERRLEFECVYGSEGDWVRLFRQDAGYGGTTLLRDPDAPGVYLTIDSWTSREAYERFRSERRAEYEAIDQRCEALTESETHVGSFERVEETIAIREEKTGDAPMVARVNEQAFGGRSEAELVGRLRSRGDALLSLVAVEGDRVVGHILFTPAVLETPSPECRLAALGPMSVVPTYQKRGIGTRLVGEGLKACRERGYEAVVVLGHPTYYPRFGFAPASGWGLRCAWSVPDEAFMALELRPGALAHRTGVVQYLPDFSLFE